MASRILVNAAVLAVACALALDNQLPKATLGAPHKTSDLIAEITPPPSALELMRRQNANNSTLIGPDNTCGFFSGKSNSYFFCAADTARCGLLKVGSTSVRACFFSTTSSYWITACADEAAVSSTRCGPSCLVDSVTRKCTLEDKFCKTITFPQQGITDYICDSTPNTSAWSVYTTFSGQVGRVYSTTFGPLTTSTSSSSRPSTSTTTLTTTTSTTSSAASSSSSSSSSNNSGGSSEAASTPVGAIVGGVIGGIALLALIGFLIWFIMRRNRKDKAAAAAAAAAAAGAQLPPHTQPMQHLPVSSYYEPPKQPYGYAPAYNPAYPHSDPRYSQQGVPSPDHGKFMPVSATSPDLSHTHSGYSRSLASGGYSNSPDYPPVSQEMGTEPHRQIHELR